jgi:alkaline phosphatase D
MARHDRARRFLVNRRGFLAASTSSLLVASRGWCGDEIVLSRPSLGGNPFTLGVASGDPDPHGFVIWTRLAPKPLEGGGMPSDPVAVRWEIADDEGFQKIVSKGGIDRATTACPLGACRSRRTRARSLVLVSLSRR